MFAMVKNCSTWMVVFVVLALCLKAWADCDMSVCAQVPGADQAMEEKAAVAFFTLAAMCAVMCIVKKKSLKVM